MSLLRLKRKKREFGHRSQQRSQEKYTDPFLLHLKLYPEHFHTSSVHLTSPPGFCLNFPFEESEADAECPHSSIICTDTALYYSPGPFQHLSVETGEKAKRSELAEMERRGMGSFQVLLTFLHQGTPTAGLSILYKIL